MALLNSAANNLIGAARNLPQSTLPMRVVDMGGKLGEFFQHPIDGISQMLGMQSAQPQPEAQTAWTPQDQSAVDRANASFQPQPKPTLRMKMPQASGPLNTFANPEAEPPETAYGFNKGWAKPGPYTTSLTPQEEAQFQSWVKSSKAPWRDAPNADYDMRGYWKDMNSGNAKQSHSAFDNTMHFPDKFKTPYSGVFSRESIYASPTAPMWQGDRLTTDDGRLVVDETPKPKSALRMKTPPKGK